MLYKAGETVYNAVMEICASVKYVLYKAGETVYNAVMERGCPFEFVV